MKTNYHLHAKRKPRTALKILLIFALCLVLGLIAGSVARPLGSVSYFVSNMIGSIVPPGFRTSHTLSKENQTLRERVAELGAENADRNTLAAENLKLKEMLGRSGKDEFVYGVVLLKPPYSPFDTFILDIGTDNGVKAGDIVVVRNLAIGTIVDAGKSYAKAELFSSPGKTFEGTLAGDITLQATGEGGGVFSAMLPIGTSVAEGDALVLPSLSSKVFGLVEKVEELSEEGFKRVLFSLPVNPSEVSSVGVIINRD